MQTLSPIFAKDPALLQSAKVRMNRNEEAAKGCVEKIKLKHQNLKVEVMPSCFTILAALTCSGAILAIVSAMSVPSEQYWLLPVTLVLIIACCNFIIVSYFQSLDAILALTPVPSLGSSPLPAAPPVTATAPATTSARGCSQIPIQVNLDLANGNEHLQLLMKLLD
ncbi:hypothetical protein QN277_005064 [Acacia crassicarpa]|uniref:Uncharacterized protein n=1 Tax=Acacia crassicarpa TaxID=499986 RepID=A0AAE1JSQ3_9FABA|nr:hypothetical protein QN277_005064 [Acacia crassicarpa]